MSIDSKRSQDKNSNAYNSKIARKGKHYKNVLF